MEARAALAVLWRLDERLGGIVARTTEPTIGLIRLAWWRERLETLDAATPPAEPLLHDVAALLLPNLGGMALAVLEGGWAALLQADPIDEAAMAAHATERGGTLFRLAAALLGEDDSRVPAAGEAWALADLAAHVRDPILAETARALSLQRTAGLFATAWPRRLRPLGALAAATRRTPGTPARVLRMLAHRLTGR